MLAETIKTDYPKVEKIFTLHEYLAREERSAYKHEFHNGQITRMSGGTLHHNLIATNVTGLLFVAVNQNDLPFTILNSDQKIYIATLNKVLYADVLVVYELPETHEASNDLLTNPILIVEVASRSTKNYDRGEKFMYYRMLPSLKEYVLIAQDKPQVETFYRERANTWDIQTETNLKSDVLFRSLDLTIPLTKIYKGIY